MREKSSPDGVVSPNGIRVSVGTGSGDDHQSDTAGPIESPVSSHFSALPDDRLGCGRPSLKFRPPPRWSDDQCRSGPDRPSSRWPGPTTWHVTESDDDHLT